MNEALFPIQVECTDTPRRFTLGARALTVVDVLDRWLGGDHRYFKVQADDGDVYILRHDLAEGIWELTLFSRRDYLGAGLPKLEAAPVVPGH